MLVNGVNSSKIQKTNFKSSAKMPDNKGYDVYKFALPYDHEKYDAVVEIARVVNQGKKTVVADGFATTEIALTHDGNAEFDPSDMFSDNQDFGYRFKLKNRETNEVVYHHESGIKLKTEAGQETPYVIVRHNRLPARRPGVMMHVIMDSFNKVDGWAPKDADKTTKDKIHNTSRNHFNLFGGDIKGLIDKADHLKKMGVSYALLTPLSKDELSNHGYWTENPSQIAKRFGDENDFDELSAKFARKGINIVLDAALVNQGLQGYHVRANNKWGADSPFKHWFKGEGYKSYGLLPSVDPASEKGKKVYPHIKIRVVNGDFAYKYSKDSIDKQAYQRDRTQRTFVQLYDDRLASKEQLEKNELIQKYDHHESDNRYDIADDNDAALLTAFPVEEHELPGLYARMDAAKGKYGDGKHLDFLQSVLKFDNFKIDVKGPGNVDTWDGNNDVLKFNFSVSNADNEQMTLRGASPKEKKEFQVATFQVQDYFQKIGAFRTRKGRNAIAADFARTIAQNVDSAKIEKDESLKTPEEKQQKIVKAYQEFFAKGHPDLPDTIGKYTPKEMIENVVKGDYQLPQFEATSSSKQFLLDSMMNYPLENIEFSDDLTAVLASPFISKRALAEEDVTKSRSDYFYHNNYHANMPKNFLDVYYEVDQLYADRLIGAADEAIRTADKEGNLGFYDKETGALSDAGKLAYPMLADDATKFLMVKILAPDVKVTLVKKEGEAGKLVYDNEALRKVGLNSLAKDKVISNFEDAANLVGQKMTSGIETLKDEDKKLLADAIKERFMGVPAKDSKEKSIAATPRDLIMVHAIMDRMGIGVDHRTDATKDTGNIDGIRNGTENFAHEWEKNIKLWTPYVDAVRKENRNSMVISEMTDLEQEELVGDGSGRFDGQFDAEGKFIDETGATTTSNYSVFFGTILRSLGGDAETGATNEAKTLIREMAEALTGESDWGENSRGIKNIGFYNSQHADSIDNSHNFIENHDKPRAMELFSTDMGVFHNYPQSQDRIGAAADFYAPDMKKKNIAPNTKALAKAKVVFENIEEVVAQMAGKKGNENINVEDAQKKLHHATQDLVQGKFKNGESNPEKFGSLDVRFAINDVIEQAREKHGLDIDDAQAKELATKTRRRALENASKLQLIANQWLVAVPGVPTVLAGSEFKMAGYEEPCKNITVSNREMTPWHDLENPHIHWSAKHHIGKTAKILNIRKEEGMSALTRGARTRLDVTDNKAVAMLSQNEESQVITLIHGLNLKVDYPEHKHYLKNDEGKNISASSQRVSIDETTEHSIDEISLEERKNNKGKVVAGLAGGLAAGTFFIDAVNHKGNEDDTFFVVVGKKIKAIATKANLDKYAKLPEADRANFKEFAPIKLKQNAMFLKKAGKVTFHGRTNVNPNHVQIQAYLNSKSYFGEQPRYTSAV